MILLRLLSRPQLGQFPAAQVIYSFRTCGGVTAAGFSTFSKFHRSTTFVKPVQGLGRKVPLVPFPRFVMLGMGDARKSASFSSKAQGSSEELGRKTGDDEKSNPKPDSEPGTDPAPTTAAAPVSASAKLKQTVRDYGATVIVFHVSMSLCSLGFFYLLVTSGLDISAIFQKLGLDESIFQSKITQGASTFVIAYAVHKIFAPVRLGITLTCTPLIVRKLRKIGFLKGPIQGT